MRLMFYISALILFSACNKALQSNIVDAPIQNHNLLQSQNVQLSPVSVSVDSSFFRSSAKVEMNFDLHQSKIKYSINDSPFRDYEKPFSVNGSSTIKSYTHKEGMLQSDTRVYQLIKVNDMLGDANLRFSVQPNDQYPG